MALPRKDRQICRRLEDFYNGRYILITGAGGFVGSVLLEILLRCFPGIHTIYILLRTKKGIDPQVRKSLIFQKPIFRKLLEENPDIVDKVKAIPGDVSVPNLGISEEDFIEVTNNTSIVFHCAAVISFLKSLRFTALQNGGGTLNVIDLCRKLPKLEALIYTSTAYSNSNRSSDIDEIIYRLPFKAEKYMKALLHGKEGEFEKLAAQCKPDWPNSYTFSKCLAENIIHDLASDLPVAIIRPSIVMPTWAGPLPSYVEKGSGLVDFSTAVGKGFVRVVYGDKDAIFDIIPADIVANTHVAAAWSIATSRCSSPFVVNCTGAHTWTVKFGEYLEAGYQMTSTHLMPKSFQKPSVTLTKNRIIYWLLVYYEHFIPAFVIDSILYFKGSKFRLLPLYQFLEVISENLSFFTTTTFYYAVNNFFELSRQLDPRDKEIIYMNLEEVSLKKICDRFPAVSNIYDWKSDKKSPMERKKAIYVRGIGMSIIKGLTLCLLCLMIYFIVFKLFYAILK